MRGEGFAPEVLLPHTQRLPAGSAVRVRRMRRTDADSVQSYIRGLSAESRRNRFLGALSEVSPAELERMCGDGGDQQATLLVAAPSAGSHRIVAEARCVVTHAGLCEVALSVTDAWQRRGLGTLLLQLVERRARELGAEAIVADALRSNDAIKRLGQKCGFSVRPGLGEARLMRLIKTLAPRAAAA
jgi:GNAT superfamily N-acetyltransferase